MPYGQGVYTVNTLDKGVIHVPGSAEWGEERSHHATQKAV